MQDQDRRADGFLTRLKRDTRGNTLAIVGAALVPLAAMIGSGLDMSRAYMAKTRLQSACDAAALAARRVMIDDEMNETVRGEAIRFLNFNFPQALYGTDAFTPVVTRPQAGSVAITANTRIPTTIMSMFGFGSLPLDVSCEASLNFVNTDVMLVLDVTGSMGNNLSGTQKMVSLRDAVMALYDELEPVQQQLESNGLRLRYGVVPYSSTVNVGRLIRGVSPDYLANSVSYQTRVANFTTPEHTAQPSTASSGWEIHNNTRTSSQCSSWVTASSANGGGPAPTPTTVTSYRGSSSSSGYSASTNWGWSGAAVTSGERRSCRRWRTVTTTTYTTRYRHNSNSSNRWTYRQATYDVSQFKLGNAATIASPSNPSNNNNDVIPGTVPTNSPGLNVQELPGIGNGIGTRTLTWNGCIEERGTVSTITASSGFNIPTAAYDLDINLIPHNEATRWRPMWPAIEYRRTGGSTSTTSGTSMSSTACPAEARRLQAWTRAAMQTYVNGLNPTGNTYHDIGMIWGARMISNAGVFADSPDTFNGMPVNRHIIFMTDGQLEPSTTVYSSYGVEVNDQRITNSSSGSGQYDRHLQRFRMICNATKGMNVSVWVIAFGTTLSDDMRDCASNSSQASTSGNRDQLIQRFRQIGNQIGALRLTQ